ncbi:MAG: STM4012 family radical SAM protein [Gemmataceae bacterium]
MPSSFGQAQQHRTLENLLNESPYQGYSYAYPHKSAYRSFDQPMLLRSVWETEVKDALFLYVHVPFCEMRCGFCNLFTQAKPKQHLSTQFLRTLEDEARIVAAALDECSFARIALGGGTPTFLTINELQRVFHIIESGVGANVQSLPTSVETSPETAEREKLQLLKAKGIDRISIGVQSFLESETSLVARPQKQNVLETALQTICELDFPIFNIDLIYGLPRQSIDTWLDSLRKALSYRPQEIYLYPLYVRPLTSLGKSSREWDDERLGLYREGRDCLRSYGYQQVSMRMFRSPDAPTIDGPVYCCQTDGMVGLGCGARSYTTNIHYSGEYAVGTRGVQEILSHYLSRDEQSFAATDYGIRLSLEEQHRRFVIQSVLQKEGLAFAAYRNRFGTEVFSDIPELQELHQLGIATIDNDRIRLTDFGIERSDTIGPWLYSESVRRLMQEYDLR